MEPKRITLDNSVFEGRLRYAHRGSSYTSRPGMTPLQVVQDTVVAKAKPPQPQFVKKPTVAVPKLASQPKSHQTAKPQTAPKTTLKPPIITKPAVKAVSKASHAPEKPAIKHHRQPEKSQVLIRKPFFITDEERVAASQLLTAPKLKHRKQSLVLYVMAGIIFAIGLAVSINGLMANHKVAAQAKRLSTSVGNSDDTAAAPSTKKPDSTTIANYAVAPNLPKYIDITKLNVHARVLSMGVNSQNQLRAPGNVYDAGWYNASAQPGQPGAMLIDGHVSSWKTNGVFYGVTKLVAGDQITVARGDNQKFTYTVVKTQLFDASNVDMSSLLVSQNTAKPGLNLISCSGDVIPGTNEFNKRIVVYAVMQ